MDLLPGSPLRLFLVPTDSSMIYPAASAEVSAALCTSLRVLRRRCCSVGGAAERQPGDVASTPQETPVEADSPS